MVQDDGTARRFPLNGTGSRESAFLTPDRLAYAYGFLISLVSLLNPLLLSISALIMLLIGLIAPLLSWRSILGNPSTKIVFIFAVPPFVSLLWSQHPDSTIYYSLQLVLTISLSLLISSSRNMTATITGLFWAHFLFGIASLIFGQVVPWEDGKYVFVGLSAAKNNYGSVNFFVCMLGVYMAHLGLRNRSVHQLGLGIGSIVVGLAGVVMSKSTGAFIAVVIGIALYSVCALYSNFSRQRRTLIALGSAAVLAIFAGLLSLTWSEIYPLLLGFAGKDSDLTGRVGLWAIADKIIDSHYWLGVGQYAFWVRGDPIPETIWAMFKIDGRIGFNFHNTYREVMVQVGMLGLVVHAAAYIILFRRQISYIFLNPRAEHILFLTITVSYLIRMPFEAIMPFPPLYPPTIFIIAALSVRPPLKQDGRRQ